VFPLRLTISTATPFAEGRKVTLFVTSLTKDSKCSVIMIFANHDGSAKMGIVINHHE